MTDVWTVERIAKLRRLYDENFSFSEIAAALGGGISRNSAIGKAHRLGIAGHKVGRKPAMGPNAIRAPKRPATQGISAAVQKINMAKAAPPKVAPAPKIKPEPFVVATVDIVPLNLGLMDLTETTCRWPIGDEPATMTFCGHDAPGGPYCPGHSAIAYQPRQSRRSGPHPAELGKAKGGIFGRSA